MGDYGKDFAFIVIGMLMEAGRKWLDKHSPAWTEFTLNVIRNIAFVCVIYYVFTGHGVSYQHPITADNATSQSVEWIRSLGQEAGNSPDENGVIELKFYGSRMFLTKSGDGYLRIDMRLDLTSEQADKFTKLSTAQSGQLNNNLTVQSAQLGLENYQIARDRLKLVVFRDVPITNTLTKEAFIDVVGTVQRSGIIMQQTLNKDFQQL